MIQEVKPSQVNKLLMKNAELKEEKGKLIEIVTTKSPSNPTPIRLKPAEVRRLQRENRYLLEEIKGLKGEVKPSQVNQLLMKNAKLESSIDLFKYALPEWGATPHSRPCSAARLKRREALDARLNARQLVRLQRDNKYLHEEIKKLKGESSEDQEKQQSKLEDTLAEVGPYLQYDKEKQQIIQCNKLVGMVEDKHGQKGFLPNFRLF